MQTTLVLSHRRVLSFGSPIRPHSAFSQGLKGNHTKNSLAFPLRSDGAPRLRPPAARRSSKVVRNSAGSET